MLQSGIGQFVAVYAQPNYSRRFGEAMQSVVGNLHSAQIDVNARRFFQGFADGGVAAKVVLDRLYYLCRLFRFSTRRSTIRHLGKQLLLLRQKRWPFFSRVGVPFA